MGGTKFYKNIHQCQQTNVHDEVEDSIPSHPISNRSLKPNTAKIMVKAWETIKKISSHFEFCGSRSLYICDFIRSMETFSNYHKTSSMMPKPSLLFSNQSNSLPTNPSTLIFGMGEKSQIPTASLIVSTVFIISLISLQ